ncbi:hypothetical protein GCM10009785_05840 [Brooklawnia cerclae]|uniref:Transcriptional regulator with XRE-family HTH domain n=1 Tax=Brooklawnia cerclae TaxID=349934 RepID=A0ABX0SEU1_9ACTN|nr:helix-turn-helix transcriptional regulator [Brooklawnia cerclae]NIH55823.1 transcriptional regulator with XRE-family HTH domain [Brooklawnia cerclae]
MPAVGERIRELRIARGLSQAELGSGRYSGSYICHIETGRRRPNTEVLDFLAERLGLDAWELDPDSQEAADADMVALLASARRLVRTRQWDEAARMATRASVIAAGAGREMRRWEADHLVAQALMSGGRYDEAAELAAGLARRSSVVGVADLRVEAHILASRAHRASGRLADAASEARAALAEADQIDPGLLSSAIVALLAALEMADSPSDTSELETRLEGLVDILDPSDASQAAWALGNLAFGRGDTEAGIVWHRRAGELCDPRAEPQTWARILQATAYFLVQSGGDLSLARRLFEDSRPLVTLLGSPGDRVDMRLVQARLDLRGDDPEAAERLLDHLLGETATLDDERLRGEVLESLAEARAVLGRVDEARAALREAAGAFEAAQAPVRALRLWHRYAELESPGNCCQRN